MDWIAKDIDGAGIPERPSGDASAEHAGLFRRLDIIGGVAAAADGRAGSFRRSSAAMKMSGCGFDRSASSEVVSTYLCSRALLIEQMGTLQFRHPHVPWPLDVRRSVVRGMAVLVTRLPFIAVSLMA